MIEQIRRKGSFRNLSKELIIPNPLLIIELFSSCLLPPASCLAFTIRGLPKRI
jgi:hypothetical protein